MPVSSEEQEFVVYVLELMQPTGPVIAKRMFGGHGIFLRGLMFALVADSTLYFKADAESEDAFLKKGLERFTYNKKGKAYSMSYYRAPEEALEEIHAMNAWAKLAYAAALRGSASKKVKKKRV